MTMLDRIATVLEENPNCVSSIELNVACPNIPNKPMICYDFQQFENTLQAITNHSKFSLFPPLGLKLAPYFDFPHFEMITSIITKYPIKYIVCCNSLGNGLYVDSENECEGFVAKHGYGGVGGGFIKHTALANVRIFYNLLNSEKYNSRSDIDIVGVGGVNSGKDAFELILCGAKAVQIGTCHWTEGSSCFERISKELETIMKQKGYKNIEEFRGKLKPYIRPSSTQKAKANTSESAANESKTSVSVAKGNLDSSMFNPLTMVLIAIIVMLLAKDCFSTGNKLP
jgi:dihydroorotate dehydrogenase (fumarate)